MWTTAWRKTGYALVIGYRKDRGTLTRRPLAAIPLAAVLVASSEEPAADDVTVDGFLPSLIDRRRCKLVICSPVAADSRAVEIRLPAGVAEAR